MTIGFIYHDDDRVLLYSDAPSTRSDALFGRYHIITTLEVAKRLKPGMRINYEPIGINFGRFICIEGDQQGRGFVK